MENGYRSRNGRKAAGVPKNFSAEERRVRGERIREVQPLAVLTRLKAITDRKRAIEERKAFVESEAAAGRFVPVDDFG